MTQELQELQDKLRMVAEYEGWVVKDFGKGYGVLYTNKKFSNREHYEWDLLMSIRYPKSFDWQIPVWSKALKELEELRVKYKQSKLEEDYSNFLILQEACTIFSGVYHQAIDSNSPSEGFEVLYKLIQFIKKYKK